MRELKIESMLEMVNTNINIIIQREKDMLQLVGTINDKSNKNSPSRLYLSDKNTGESRERNTKMTKLSKK